MYCCYFGTIILHVLGTYVSLALRGKVIGILCTDSYKFVSHAVTGQYTSQFVCQSWACWAAMLAIYVHAIMHLLDSNLLGCHVCTSGESVEECGCKGECVKYT